MAPKSEPSKGKEKKHRRRLPYSLLLMVSEGGVTGVGHGSGGVTGGVTLGLISIGEEQPEAGMGLHGVQLLLQLHQPARGQVDVLQHHPTGQTSPLC